jgi:hypothetical protein
VARAATGPSVGLSDCSIHQARVASRLAHERSCRASSCLTRERSLVVEARRAVVVVRHIAIGAGLADVKRGGDGRRCRLARDAGAHMGSLARRRTPGSHPFREPAGRGRGRPHPSGGGSGECVWPRDPWRRVGYARVLGGYHGSAWGDHCWSRQGCSSSAASGAGPGSSGASRRARLWSTRVR